jgi:crotonobetainyl-CoA:carnitine CoA-transferase CaiB-like acyl-CoA transferase
MAGWGAGPKRTGPLAGVKVLDLSSVVMGPYATLILGDLGADVIRIENGGGDAMRHAGRSPGPGMGPIFMALNRNKRSVVLDLKTSEGAAAARELAADCDVFFHNIRAEAIERLGLGYAAVKALRPEVIYVHCSGYGSDGPYAGRQAYDDLIQAASGFADLLPRTLGDGRPRYAPALVADKTAGLHAAYATMAALFHHARTGEGQFVEVPMFESFTAWNLIENLYGQTFIREEGAPPLYGPGYTRSINPRRRPYPTLDGHIGIVPYSDGQWFEFFALGGRPELAEDPRFKTMAARTEHVGELYAEVEAVAATKTTDAWMTILHQAGIPAMRFHTLDGVVDDEHLRDSGFLHRREHPTAGPHRAMRHPVMFERTPADIAREAPGLGEHTEEVLGAPSDKT